MKRVIPVLLAIMAASVIQAETRYVSDILYVPLRSGPSSQYKILHRGLKTGTPLEILGLPITGSDESYIKVRSRSGSEGYIPTQYLLKELPAKDQLTEILTKNKELVSKSTEYRTLLTASESSNRELTGNLKSSNQQIQTLKQELNHIREISGNSLKIDNRNKTLVVSNERMKAQLNTLQTENQQLSDSTQQREYLYGALTLLMGVLLGLFGPLLKPMKKSNWS